MSLAPVAYLLFQKVMNQDPSDDRWEARPLHPLPTTPPSPCTLSCSSAATIEMSDLEALRTWGALTPSTPNTSTPRA